MSGERKRFTAVLKNRHGSGNGWKGMGGNSFDLVKGPRAPALGPMEKPFAERQV